MAKRKEDLIEEAQQKARSPQVFNYKKPEGLKAGKSIVTLGTSGLLRGSVQIVKKGEGDNNMHIH